MATIRKRGDYAWEAQVRRLGYPAQTKTFTYRQDAETWARMVESEMERGLYISRAAAEAMVLREALTRYEIEVTSKKRGAAKEAYVLKRFAGSNLAARALATIRSTDLAAWRDERLKAVSSGTVLRELNVLSHVFSTARREWGMEGLVNPVEGITKPKDNRARDRRITDLELEAICRASQSPILPAAFRLAIETGMRRSEIAGLCWSDVDLERQVAHLDETKNGDARDVPLSTVAVATLRSLKAGPRRLDGMIFGCRPDTITQAFIRAVRRARLLYEEDCLANGRKPDPEHLRGVRLHDGRHEGTSRFFEKGLDLMEAASITGHKDPRQLRRYTHLRAENLAKKLG